MEAPEAWGIRDQGRANSASRISGQDGRFLKEWKQFSRSSGIFIAKDGTIYVADSGPARIRAGMSAEGGRRASGSGSARTGKVTAFIEDRESTRAEHSGAEGVGVDAAGNVYGAVVRRMMLEKHIPSN